MRWHVSLIGTVVSAALLLLPCARAEEQSLQQQYLYIYLKINEAEHFEKQGDYRSALDDFTDCYNRLYKIHTTSPNWESALVIKRMEDCKSKIAELTPKAVSQPVTTPTPTPSPSPSPTPVSIPNGDTTITPQPASPDTAALQQQIVALKQEVEDWKAKYNNSQLEMQSLKDKLASVNKELADAKSKKGQSMDDRIGKLLSENKDLTDKLADAQKQIESLKSPDPNSSLSLVRAQLKNAQSKLDEANAANAALQETTSTLKSQLEQAQSDLNAAKQQLAATPTTSPDYVSLKRENEVMRGILTREIQEQSRRDESKRLAQEEFDRLKITSKVLQEQLDILGSPMTPPTTDEERTLLASLKGPGMSAPVPPPDSGNSFSTSTNVAAVTPPPTAPPTNDVTVVTPPINTSTTTDTNTVTVVNPTPTPTPDNSAQPPVTVVSTSASDTTSTALDTNAAPTPSPAPTDTAAVTPTPAPTSVTSSTPAPVDNTPTVTKLPDATTTYTDTTINNGGDPNAKKNDPTQYANKPKLPDDMRDTAQQAADLFKMQRYDEAAAKYQSIIDKYPESLYAWSNLGVVRFQQGNLTEALRALQQAVKLSPTDAFSYSNLGIVYYQLNQYENAIDALERATALDPNDAKAFNYLGCACSQKGWQEVAEKKFRKAIDIDPNFGDAHFNLALVYAMAKPPSLELARRHYKTALDLGIAKDPQLEKLLGQ